jgi:hypothetical protein
MVETGCSLQCVAVCSSVRDVTETCNSEYIVTVKKKRPCLSAAAYLYHVCLFQKNVHSVHFNNIADKYDTYNKKKEV